VTVENRILVSPSDILSIQYKCKCGASATIPLLNHGSVPNGCAACREEWFTPVSDPRQNDIFAMVRALSEVQRNLAKAGSGSHLQIMLELSSHGLNIQK
jgi:hypothetical protein